MAADDGDAGDSGTDQKFGSGEDFAGFVDEFLFFGGVAVGEEIATMREEVAEDLVGSPRSCSMSWRRVALGVWWRK